MYMYTPAENLDSSSGYLGVIDCNEVILQLHDVLLDIVDVSRKRVQVLIQTFQLFHILVVERRGGRGACTIDY